MTRERRDLVASLLKASAVAAVLWGAITFTVSAGNTVAYAQSSVARIDTLGRRVDEHDKALTALSYMTCVSFAETHAASQVPAYCNAFVR